MEIAACPCARKFKMRGGKAGLIQIVLQEFIPQPIGWIIPVERFLVGSLSAGPIIRVPFLVRGYTAPAFIEC